MRYIVTIHDLIAFLFVVFVGSIFVAVIMAVSWKEKNVADPNCQKPPAQITQQTELI